MTQDPVQTAIVRKPNKAISECALTFLQRQPIDLEIMRRQHREYQRVLAENSVRVIELPELAGYADSVFVEDTAVILPEMAIITKPGIASRVDETPSIAEVLQKFRPLVYIEAPGTLEGGDVLVADKTLFVGLSSRTNSQAIGQLHLHTQAFGYSIREVEVLHCLHLKTGCSFLGGNTVLLNPYWVSPRNFEGLKTIFVNPEEPFAANCLVVSNKILTPIRFSKTRKALEQLGFQVEGIEISEFQKAEAGLTCMSLIFHSSAVPS